MYPHALIDLHCDTLTALRPEDAPLLDALRDPARRRDAFAALTDRVQETDTLDLPGRHFSLSALPEGVRWCQCCAIFIPDGLSQEEAVAYYHLHQSNFHRQMETLTAKALPCRTAADIEAAWAQGKAAAILTVENGSALAGQLDRVATLARDGVRMVTLTWNGENEIGSGSVTGHGLSGFGREAVQALEGAGILVDVSHLNDQGFEDFLSVARCRQPLQRPGRLRPPAQPHRRTGAGDGSPGVPHRAELLQHLPAAGRTACHAGRPVAARGAPGGTGGGALPGPGLRRRRRRPAPLSGRPGKICRAVRLSLGAGAQRPPGRGHFMEKRPEFFSQTANLAIPSCGGRFFLV